MKFGLFIPTNGRADEQVTLNMMRDSGYTGDWWLVCDDLDDDLDRYIDLYGDKVLVFDKREWAHKTDRVTNRMELGTVLYARNYILSVGREMGYDVIGVFDDDLDSLAVRYEKEEKLQSKRIVGRMDELTDWVCEFMLSGNVSAMSFAHSGAYFGGLEGNFREGLIRNPSGAWFINLESELDYRGVVNEDSIYVRDSGRTGLLVFTLMDVMFNTPERGSNEGGHNEMYEDMTEYIHSMYVKIASPSTMSILGDGRRRTSRVKVSPEIISEEWRK